MPACLVVLQFCLVSLDTGNECFVSLIPYDRDFPSNAPFRICACTRMCTLDRYLNALYKHCIAVAFSIAIRSTWGRNFAQSTPNTVSNRYRKYTSRKARQSFIHRNRYHGAGITTCGFGTQQRTRMYASGPSAMTAATQSGACVPGAHHAYARVHMRMLRTLVREFMWAMASLQGRHCCWWYCTMSPFACHPHTSVVGHPIHPTQKTRYPELYVHTCTAAREYDWRTVLSHTRLAQLYASVILRVCMRCMQFPSMCVAIAYICLRLQSESSASIPKYCIGNLIFMYHSLSGTFLTGG